MGGSSLLKIPSPFVFVLQKILVPYVLIHNGVTSNVNVHYKKQQLILVIINVQIINLIIIRKPLERLTAILHVIVVIVKTLLVKFIQCFVKLPPPVVHHRPKAERLEVVAGDYPGVVPVAPPLRKINTPPSPHTTNIVGDSLKL